MEITLDIGKDVHHELIRVAKTQNKAIDITALEMLSLGLRVHVASMNKEKEDEQLALSEEDKLRDILKIGIQNQELISEVLSIVFDREKSRMGAFDTDTAIKFSEQLAEKCIKGRELL